MRESIPAVRARSTNNRTAHFLMDGEEFFGKLAELLGWVQKSTAELTEVPPGTYVRMAYWAMETDTVVSREGDKTIGVALQELADRGIPVDVILWLPGDLDTIGKDNFTARTAAQNRATASALHGYKDRILVYLQKHPGVLPGQALHQKIFIAAVGGQLQVVVGGFNIEKEYWDTAYHWGAHPITGGFHTLHDTAVLLEGPAAADVEGEWMRRWKKQLSSGPFATNDPRAVARAAAFAVPKAQPTGGLDVTVLTTEPDGAKHIREEIITLIRDASRYVYAENFQFFDPAIVRAACTGLRNKKGLEVCVVIPDPACDPTKVNTYLNRIAYAKMGFCACEGEATIVYGEGRTLPLGGTVLDESRWFNDWLQKDKLVSGSLEVPLETIESFQPEAGGARRVQLYCPVRYPASGTEYAESTKIYVHSKLMIVDNFHVIVGSANFGYRSMEYDGELSVHVASEGFAVSVLQRLFPHYNVHSTRAVPAALRDEAVPASNMVKLVPRSPGELGVKLADVNETVRTYMGYTWI